MNRDMLMALMMAMIRNASQEMIRAAGPAVLNAMEEAVKKSDNKVDDLVILPMIHEARKAFNWTAPEAVETPEGGDPVSEG